MKIREESEGEEFITVQSFDTHIELIFLVTFSRKNKAYTYLHNIQVLKIEYREQDSFWKVVGGKNELIIDNDKNNNKNNAMRQIITSTQSNWGCSYSRWMIGKWEHFLSAWKRSVYIFALDSYLSTNLVLSTLRVGNQVGKGFFYEKGVVLCEFSKLFNDILLLHHSKNIHDSECYIPSTKYRIETPLSHW